MIQQIGNALRRAVVRVCRKDEAAEPGRNHGRARLMFHAGPEVKASIHAGGMVLIHLRTGVVFTSNRAGALIWAGITERRSLDEVTARVSREFRIEQELARRDAERFLAQLQAEGLLVADGA